MKVQKYSYPHLKVSGCIESHVIYDEDPLNYLVFDGRCQG